MALSAHMPLHGSTSAPKSDGKTPLLLPRFLEDVDILGTAATLTDTEKVQTSICYADLEESEGWELLPVMLDSGRGERRLETTSD